MVKSAYCTSRGPKFNAQHPFSGVSPAPGRLSQHLRTFTGGCPHMHIPYNGAHTTLNQGRKIFLKNMLNKIKIEVDVSESLLCSSC